MAKFSFGSDPEFMLEDQDGCLHSAVEIVLGDPDNRINLHGHSFYHDNVLAECSIKPANTRQEVLDTFKECLGLYAKMIAPYRLVARASADFPDSELRSIAARTVGCRPESSAYTLDFLPRPGEIIETTGFRSAGGHVHIGVESIEWRHQDYAHYGAKMLDLFLGIPSVYLDQDPTSKARRQIYGSAGSFRRQSYGIEYRTLSNFWLASPRLVGLIWDICEYVVDFVNNRRYLELWTENEEAVANYEDPEECYQCHGYDVEKLKAAIDTGDKRRARPFMNILQQYLPQNIVNEINALSKPTTFDLYKEWSL